MTKVSVFGQQPTETKELKKIEFELALSSSNTITEAELEPRHFRNIMLIQTNYSNSLDAILAWDDLHDVTIYLGHWNDGVV